MKELALLAHRRQDLGMSFSTLRKSMTCATSAVWGSGCLPQPRGRFRIRCLTNAVWGLGCLPRPRERFRTRCLTNAVWGLECLGCGVSLTRARTIPSEVSRPSPSYEGESIIQTENRSSGIYVGQGTPNTVRICFVLTGHGPECLYRRAQRGTCLC